MIFLISTRWVFYIFQVHKWWGKCKMLDDITLNLSSPTSLNFRSIDENTLWLSLIFCIKLLEIFVSILLKKIITQSIQHFFLPPTGKPLKSLPDLLREYNLPPGLFPQNMTCYEFDESKSKLIVYLPSACEISFKDSSVVRYATRVKGTLQRGKLTNIEGMKTKVLVWVKVTSVSVEGYKSDKVWFTAGVKKSRSKDAYEKPHDAIRVGEF